MRHLLTIIGIATMVGLTLVLYVTFTAAYFSPTQTVRVAVNNHDEANLEFVLLSALLPVNIVSALLAIRLVEDDKRAESIARRLETRR